MQTQRLLETIRIHSSGENAFQDKFARGPGQLNFRGSLCRLSLTAVLPENSLNKYGAYLSLQGGPYMGSNEFGVAREMENHRRESMIQGCTILPGAQRRNCTLKFTPPVGYALDRRFVDNSLYVDFFTVDPERMHQLRTTRKLTPNKKIYVDLKMQWKRCTPEELVATKVATQKATPSSHIINRNNAKNNNNRAEEDLLLGKILVDDTVVFGPTEYSLAILPDKDTYYTVDYRTYFITAVTGVDYEVSINNNVIVEYNNSPKTAAAQRRVIISSPSKKRKFTPLTVFFAKEPTDFYLGLDCQFDRKDKTNTTCIPPRNYKLKGTKVCEGLNCKGSLRGLDPKQEYVLWVSYPRYNEPGNWALNYSKKKMKSPYTTEMVTVKAWAHGWSLGKVNTTTTTTSDDYFEEFEY
jgi:hypothetical protein